MCFYRTISFCTLNNHFWPLLCSLLCFQNAGEKLMHTVTWLNNDHFIPSPNCVNAISSAIAVEFQKNHYLASTKTTASFFRSVAISSCVYFQHLFSISIHFGFTYKKKKSLASLSPTYLFYKADGWMVDLQWTSPMRATSRSQLLSKICVTFCDKSLPFGHQSLHQKRECFYFCTFA